MSFNLLDQFPKECELCHENDDGSRYGVIEGKEVKWACKSCYFEATKVDSEEIEMSKK